MEENRIKFRRYCLFEDNLFLTKCLHFAKSIGYEKRILYYRVKRERSITSDWEKNFEHYLLAVRDIDDFYESIKSCASEKINSYCSNILSIYSKFSDEYKEKYKISVISTLIYLGKYDRFGKKRFGENPFDKNLEEWWFTRKHTSLDMNSPKTLGQVVQYIKVHDFKKFKSILADKWRVREYISDKIGEKYLTKIYGVYCCFDEIDFKKFKDKQIVLKCNHGSGWNHIILDTNNFDRQKLKSDFDRWMNTDYSKFSYELHYSCIPRRIIAEEYIDPKVSNFEIQVYCINKKPEFISVETVKDSSVHKRCILDTNGNELNFMITPEHYLKLDSSSVNKKTVIDCVSLTNKIITDTPFARYDFIIYNGEIKFREITFTSGSGLSTFSPEAYDYKFGSMIDIPKKNPIKIISMESISGSSKQEYKVECNKCQKLEKQTELVYKVYSLTTIPGVTVFIPKDFCEFKRDYNLLSLCENNMRVYSWAYSMLYTGIPKNVKTVVSDDYLSRDEEIIIISILHEYPEILKFIHI